MQTVVMYRSIQNTILGGDALEKKLKPRMAHIWFFALSFFRQMAMKLSMTHAYRCILYNSCCFLVLSEPSTPYVRSCSKCQNVHARIAKWSVILIAFHVFQLAKKIPLSKPCMVGNVHVSCISMSCLSSTLDRYYTNDSYVFF